MRVTRDNYLAYTYKSGTGWIAFGGAHNSQLYIGTTPGVNLGVVSTNPNHLGGATIPIGFSIQ